MRQDVWRIEEDAVTRWVFWLGLMLIWTIALEFPGREPEDLLETADIDAIRTLFAKIVHVCGYAFLTGMSGRLPMPMRLRWLLVLFLVSHAWLTEWLQELLFPICFRGGSLGDVGLDILGIALGAALTWSRWNHVEWDRGFSTKDPPAA